MYQLSLARPPVAPRKNNTQASQHSDSNAFRDLPHPPISYMPHRIVETIHCAISVQGVPYMRKKHLKESDAAGEILVAENWNDDRLSFKLYQDGGGYLGSGYYKFGVTVSIYPSFDLRSCTSTIMF